MSDDGRQTIWREIAIVVVERANVRNIIEVMIRCGFAIYLRSACMDDEEKAGMREGGKYAILA